MNKLIEQIGKFELNINYKSVCELLTRGHIDDAKKEFEKISEKWSDKNNIVVYRMYLNSLVYSIYYYVLYMHDTSLSKSCHHCTLIMHKDISKEDFLNTSFSIIDTYYDEMIEKNIIVVNPVLKSVFEYIENNLNKPISLDSAAQTVHVNKSYLSQLFKNKTGVTFSTYLNNRKLNHARDLLINTDLSVVEISEECGYKNSNYFSTIFTKKVGMSPGSFRKNSSIFNNE